jgi:hypothetical protein
MINTSTIFDSLWTAMPEARLSARTPKLTVNGLCSSVIVSRETGEQGAFLTAPVEVRIKASDEIPAESFALGGRIEIQRIGAATWTTARVISRRTTGGVLTLTLGGVNE